MRIDGVIWLRHIVDKLASKHQVTPEEVEEALTNKPKLRFMEKGERKGGRCIRGLLGKSDEGRYLSVLFIYKLTKEALILSARDMARKERRRYAKK